MAAQATTQTMGTGVASVSTMAAPITGSELALVPGRGASMYPGPAGLASTGQLSAFAQSVLTQPKPAPLPPVAWSGVGPKPVTAADLDGECV
jgi:hypothetical protein